MLCLCKLLIDSSNIKYHQFAEDTQLFVTLDAVNSAQTVSCLSECTAACRETLDTVQQSAAESRQIVPAFVNIAESLLSEEQVTEENLLWL